MPRKLDLRDVAYDNAREASGRIDGIPASTPSNRMLSRLAGFAVDSNGDLIDLTRPIIRNRDGSRSTERSMTVNDPRLNGGLPTNIPSIWDGMRLPEGAAIARAVDSGKTFPFFESQTQAARPDWKMEDFLPAQVGALEDVALERAALETAAIMEAEAAAVRRSEDIDQVRFR